MSRIGKAPITVPDKVTVTVEDNLVSVKGPKGELSRQISKEPSDDKVHRSLHGLSRTLINNMIIGVTEGYSKHLEIQGVGYRVAKKGKALSFTLGFSHPCVMDPPIYAMVTGSPARAFSTTLLILPASPIERSDRSIIS